jgi:hypothetical protein
MPSRKEIAQKYDAVDIFTPQKQHRGVPASPGVSHFSAPLGDNFVCLACTSMFIDCIGPMLRHRSKPQQASTLPRHLSNIQNNCHHAHPY